MSGQTAGWGPALMQDWGLLRARVARPGFWPRFALLAAILAVVYASLTSIVFLTGGFGINPSAELVRVLPIGGVVVLTALLLAIIWIDARQTGKTSSPKAGLLGSFAAIFATGCPICQPIWLVWLGLGQASLFLIDLSVWISLASIALLLYGLHAKLNENCRL